MLDKLRQLAQQHNISHVEFFPKFSAASDSEYGLHLFDAEGKKYLHPFDKDSKDTVGGLVPEAFAFFEHVGELLDGINHPIVLDTQTGSLKCVSNGNDVTRMEAGFAYVIAQMQALGATEAELSYSGSGDSGDMFKLDLENENGRMDVDSAVLNNMEDFFYDLLKREHGGWEIDGGADGTISTNLNASGDDPKIVIEHYSHYEESSLEFDEQLEGNDNVTEIKKMLRTLLPENAMLSVEFYGSNDSSDGTFMEAYLPDENDGRKKLNLEDHLNPKQFSDVEHLALELVSDMSPGWENNGGGSGEINFDLSEKEDVCHFEMYTTYSDSNYYETQWDIVEVFDYDPKRDGELEDFLLAMRPAPEHPSPSM